jgi:hypothetical protein
MASIFSKFKDPILDFIEEENNLRFSKKNGNIFNNYTRGDFIIVGGRKHQESSFIPYYVISPFKKNKCEETRNPLM